MTVGQQVDHVGAGGLGVPHLHTGAPLVGNERAATQGTNRQCVGDLAQLLPRAPPGRKMGEDVHLVSTGWPTISSALPCLSGTLSLRTLSAASHCGQQGRARARQQQWPLCVAAYGPHPCQPHVCVQQRHWCPGELLFFQWQVT